MNLYFNSGYVPRGNRLNAFEATVGSLVDAISESGLACRPLTLASLRYFTPTFSAVFNDVSESLENPRSTGGTWVDLQSLQNYKAVLQGRIEDLNSSISRVEQSVQSLQDTESNQLTWQSVDTLVQSIADDLGVVDPHALWKISRLFAVDVYTGYCALVAELDRALSDFRNYLDNQVHRVDEITASVLRMMPANRWLRSLTKLQHRWYQRHVSHPSDTLRLAADGCF